jgi:hypothetical protein
LAEERWAELREEHCEVVAMFVVLDELDLFEPKLGKVLALLLVAIVVEACCRCNQVLLFELRILRPQFVAAVAASDVDFSPSSENVVV